MVSSHQTKDLECFSDSSNIPWNSPNIHCPDLIATAPQMSVLSLCALLFLQSHLFLICVALTYNDSRKVLPRLCQIPRICQFKRLLVSWSAPRTFASSFPFPEKCLFYMSMIVSIEWLSLVALRRVDDCVEIHILHWECCVPQLSNHSNVRLLALLYRCVFCKEPL